MRERVIGYVDSFNLYFGLKAKGWPKLLWHDPALLIKNLLKPGQDLIQTKYFTARLSGPGLKWHQQKVFLEALEELGSCSIHYGRYQAELHRCSRCGLTSKISKEKMTDVSIALEMITDAHDDLFDTAILVSGDGDLTPALQKVLSIPKKRVVVAFPPRRVSQALMKACSGHFVVGRAKLSSSQLPDSVMKADGTILRRPEAWR